MYKICPFRVHVLIICTFFVVFSTYCKPQIPEIKDYTDNYPCYAYDKCKTLQAYGSKEDCKLELQKCFYYSDYQKCEKLTDDNEKNKCYNKLSIRY